MHQRTCLFIFFYLRYSSLSVNSTIGENKFQTKTRFKFRPYKSNAFMTLENGVYWFKKFKIINNRVRFREEQSESLYFISQVVCVPTKTVFVIHINSHLPASTNPIKISNFHFHVLLIFLPLYRCFLPSKLVFKKGTEIS